MKDQIKWVLNTMPKSDDRQLPIMSLSNVAKARFFHSTFPQYSVTPLDRLDGMAQYLGLAGLCVKNESFRFGLNAFKVLGGSFAMAKYIAKEMGRDVSEMTYDYLTSEAFRQEFGHATFFTATDGNHGRGVAWAAHKLGQKAVVHMPKGSSQADWRFPWSAPPFCIKLYARSRVRNIGCVRFCASFPAAPKGRGNGEFEFLAVLFRSKKIPAGNPAGRAAHNGRLRPSFSFTGRSNCVKRRLVVDAAC